MQEAVTASGLPSICFVSYLIIIWVLPIQKNDFFGTIQMASLHRSMVIGAYIWSKTLLIIKL